MVLALPSRNLAEPWAAELEPHGAMRVREVQVRATAVRGIGRRRA